MLLREVPDQKALKATLETAEGRAPHHEPPCAPGRDSGIEFETVILDPGKLLGMTPHPQHLHNLRLGKHLINQPMFVVVMRSKHEKQPPSSRPKRQRGADSLPLPPQATVGLSAASPLASGVHTPQASESSRGGRVRVCAMPTILNLLGVSRDSTAGGPETRRSGAGVGGTRGCVGCVR